MCFFSAVRMTVGKSLRRAPPQPHRLQGRKEVVDRVYNSLITASAFPPPMACVRRQQRLFGLPRLSNLFGTRPRRISPRAALQCNGMTGRSSKNAPARLKAKQGRKKVSSLPCLSIRNAAFLTTCERSASFVEAYDGSQAQKKIRQGPRDTTLCPLIGYAEEATRRMTDSRFASCPLRRIWSRASRLESKRGQ